MMENHSESDSSSSSTDTCADENTNKMEKGKRSRSKKKRTRGPTKLKKLEGKGPFPLQWDNAGCPTGKFATKYASYCGKKVRSQVNINFDDWDKDVEDSLKDLLWRDIAKKFQVHESHKPDVLSSCGSKWRDFKGKLTRKYIRNKHPKYDSPADCYSFIEPTEWEKFKKSRETEEFKEKSRKASESRKQSVHPHLMGRRGYNQRVAEWVAESSTSPSSPSPKPVGDLVLDRSWRWIKGRTKSDGKVPNKKTQEVADEMAELNKKVASGEFVPNRYDDVLSRSLGKKEHPGRVRGFSTGVTIKDVFGKSHRSSKRSKELSDVDVAEITQKLQKQNQESFSHFIRQELTGILKRMGIPVPEDFAEYESSCQSVDPVKNLERRKETDDLTPSPLGASKEKQTSKSSTSIKPIKPTSEPNLIELKEPTKCRLTCVHDSVIFNVAEATAYPNEDENQLVHGMPLLLGNVRVSIDKVLQGTAPLPVPTKYHERVADAAGSFVQWPKELIVIGDQESLSGSPLAANKENQTSNDSVINPRTEPKTAINPTEPKSDDFMSAIGPECKKLHDLLSLMVPEAKTFEVVLPAKVFFFETDKTIFIIEEDINQLLRMAFLNVSCIQLFMMYLQKHSEEINEGSSSIAFLCPTIVSQISDNKEHNIEVMKYVERSLFARKDVSVVLVPFCQEMHWTLIIIFPLIQEAYFCDPLSSKRRNMTFKYIIQGAFRGFKACAGYTLTSGMSLKWTNFECHQQPGSTECGYYVMRYMLDIVRHYNRNVADYKKWFGSKKAYTVEEVNEVRDLWATYLMTNHL